MTDNFKQKLQELSTTPVLVPGSYTSAVQPVGLVAMYLMPYKAAVEKMVQKHILHSVDQYVHGKFFANERFVLLS